MTEKIALMAVLLLATFGLSQLILWMVDRLLADKRITGVYVVPLYGHQEDAEYIVRAAQSIESRQLGTKVLLYDVGLDDDSRLLLEQVCRKRGGCLLDSAGELLQQFSAENETE